MGWTGWSALVLSIIAAVVAAAVVAQRINESRDARRFPAPGQLVDVGGGRRLHLLCKGSGDGPTIVIEW